MGAPVNHIDLCVSSLARSLSFYRDLLGHPGGCREGTIAGERGEVVHYLGGPAGSVGLRERQSPGSADRYRVGVHDLAFDAPSRAVVDAAGDWLRRTGATIDGGPGERDYAPGVLRRLPPGPDALKLGVVHQPG